MKEQRNPGHQIFFKILLLFKKRRVTKVGGEKTKCNEKILHKPNFSVLLVQEATRFQFHK